MLIPTIILVLSVAHQLIPSMFLIGFVVYVIGIILVFAGREKKKESG